MAANPLTRTSLYELAIHYAARYATTRLKLRRYLERKVRERGWVGEAVPDYEPIIERMTELGAVDDRVFAEAKAGALGRRGYGAGRVKATLAAAGVDKELRGEVAGGLDEAAAAEAYAKRRRLGRYRAGTTDMDQARRDMGAMLRAGHRFETARAALAVEIEE